MKMKWTLRAISLIMLIVAVIFVCCALACPTLGSSFYIFGIKIGADIWRAFYAFYAIVMVSLFVASFLVKKK